MSNVLVRNFKILSSNLYWQRVLTIKSGRIYSFQYGKSASSQTHREESGSSSTSSDSDSEHSESKQSQSAGSGSHELDYLYPGHIPTNLFQKALLSVGSAAVAITSPWRGDSVATMGETTGYFALVQMRQKMLEDETGRLILQDKPRINTQTVDMEYLRNLPDDTLGKTYVSWLDRNRASPDERLPVHFVDDVDLWYVMTRYREIHDLLHTVLGMPTNMLGEIVVKWVEAIQLGLPMCALGAMFGPVRLGPKHMQRYLNTHVWWAIRNGRQAKFLLNFYYEKHWDWSIDDIRQELNLEPPPKTPEKKKESTPL